MAPTPIDSKLYDKVVAQATLIFKSTRGIYRSAWIVKEYKRLGGTYTGLRRWFKEKWIGHCIYYLKLHIHLDNISLSKWHTNSTH